MHNLKFAICILQFAIIVLSPGHHQHTANGDEGMWLFNNPPKKLLKEKLRLRARRRWLKHLQQSAVRFNNGGSGSFVSADGLVMTNHHVGADALQKLSTKERDLSARTASTPRPATRNSSAPTRN